MKSSSGHKPRIAMLSIEDAKKAAIAEGISEMMAPLSIFRILLKNPPLAREIGNTLNMLLFKGNQLDGRLRELIIMRLGWATGSNYEWTQHWRVAVGMKIPEDVILAVKDWENSKILTDADKAVLDDSARPDLAASPAASTTVRKPEPSNWPLPIAISGRPSPSRSPTAGEEKNQVPGSLPRPSTRPSTWRTATPPSATTRRSPRAVRTPWRRPRWTPNTAI